MRGTSFEKPPCFRGESLLDKQARVHIYSLALIFYLWDRPHYRNGTFQIDMVKNLRDVAVPGTGISLKWFCYFKWTAFWYLLVVYPLVCFAAALNEWYKCLHYPKPSATYIPLSQVNFVFNNLTWFAGGQ